MAIIAKPDIFPDWALLDVQAPVLDGGQYNVEEPPQSYKNEGNKPNEEPPRQFDNWVKRISNNWLKYLAQNSYKGVQFKFFESLRTPVHIIPKGIEVGNPTWTINFGKSLKVEGPGDNYSYPSISAVCRPFNYQVLSDTDLIPAFFNESLGWSKRTDVVWDEGDGVGCNAYGSISTGMWIYLFVLTNDQGSVDFATDDDIRGVNISSNSDIIDAGYTHLACIGGFPWISQSSQIKFPHIISAYNNMFYYDEDEIIIHGITDDVTSYNSRYLQMSTDDGNVNLLPPMVTQADISINNDSTGNIIYVKGNDFDYQRIPSQRMQKCLINALNVIEYKWSNTGGNNAEILVHGYKNPALLMSNWDYPI